MIIKRGEIFLANLEPIQGSEQGGIKPVLIVQNDISNKHSPVTIISAITSKIFEKEFPTNISLLKEDTDLDKESTILLNQLRTIDKRRLLRKIDYLNPIIIKKVDMALKISLGLE